MIPIGIDLGTSSSAIAYFDGKEPKIIPNIFNETSIPSKVILTQDGRFYVGREAANHPERYESYNFTVGSVKRIMHNTRGFVMNNKRYYPQIISAMILADLKRQAEEFLKTEVEEAVICIPCNFGVIQRCATIEAAEMAGFKVLRVLNEATAAAVAFSHLFRNAEERELVFDLGAGTLDLSLIEYWKEGGIKVEAIEGEEFLGGDDFDERIIRYIVEDTKRTQGFDPIEDQPAQWHEIAKLRLKEAAEKAKIELSSQSRTRIFVPYIRNILGKPQHIDLELTDYALASISSDLIAKVMQLLSKMEPQLTGSEKEIETGEMEHEVKKTVDAEKRLRDKIFFRNPKKEITEKVKYKVTNKVYLPLKFVFTGGASKMKCLNEKVTYKYHKHNFITRGKELVAMGAAICAAIKMQECRDLLLLDCMPKSIGIGLKDDKYQVIFPKNTIVPSAKKDTFTTTVENQKYIHLPICEGEYEKASLNRKIIDLEFGPLLNAPVGVPKIEVNFDVDDNNVLNIQAKDLGTDKALQTINTASPYTGLDVNLKDKIKTLLENWVNNKIRNASV